MDGDGLTGRIAALWRKLLDGLSVDVVGDEGGLRGVEVPASMREAPRLGPKGTLLEKEDGEADPPRNQD